MALTEVDAARLNDNIFNTVGPFSNRIINGDMRFDQRNAGVSINPGSGDTYTLDRWQIGATQSAKMSIQQSTTAPPGFSNSLLVTTIAAYTVTSGDLFRVTENIEGFNFADMAFGTASAKTVTLSFWVRSSLTGTFGGSLQNSAYDRSYPFSYSISAANTWEYKAITITGDTSGTWVGSTNGTGVRVNFSVGAGSSNSGTAGAWAAGGLVAPTGATSVVGTNGATFYITGVQLEAGSVATPFERRSYGQELSLCQRYYQKSYDINTAPGTNTNNGRTFTTGRCTGTNVDYCTTVVFPVRMRAQPTMKFYLTAGTADSWYNTSGTNPNPGLNMNNELGFSVYLSDGTTAGQAGFGYGQWTASAEL